MNRERRHPLIPLPKQPPPSALNYRPSITSGISLKPIGRRQVFSASNANFHTIVRVAVRDPQPFVRLVRNRTVAYVDSIGLQLLIKSPL